jgi:hypothetical protein
MPTNLEAPHDVLGITLLPTGRLILATAKRTYELKDNVWTPMHFADDPVDPEPIEPPATVNTSQERPSGWEEVPAPSTSEGL